MKIKYKKDNTFGQSSNFNVHALSEVIVHFDDGSADSCFTRDLEVFLEKKQEWKDLNQAFKDKDIIPNNYNQWFGEPKTEADKVRGYFD